jgi:RNA recognition motif-containing protein
MCYNNLTYPGCDVVLYPLRRTVKKETHPSDWRNIEVKLYVGNLSYDTTEDDLRALFAQAGTVQSVALIKDRDSGRSKGFAFVEMSTQVEAQNAITQFSGKMLHDRELTVNLARPREERPRGDYGNRGGGRSRDRGGRRRQ